LSATHACSGIELAESDALGVAIRLHIREGKVPLVVDTVRFE
jgi:hypothetical protein